jgi:hypothetical protein
MKFYKLTRKEAVEYDEAIEMIVRVKSSKQAREIAADNRGDESDYVWLKPEWSTCREVKVEGEPGLICKETLDA